MSPVFAREHEIAALDRFLTAARERFSVLVIEGEPGIGKTALWRHAVRTARAGVSHVLACRTAESEFRLAFSALGDILALLDEEVLCGVPGPQRHALEVALLRTSPAGTPPDPRAVAMGVLSVLDRLTCRGPVLLAIDDVQWLDRSSAAALSFALRRVDPSRPLGVLATARSRAGSTTERLGFGLLPARIERLRPGPLGMAALSRLVRDELDLVLPRPTMTRIEHESGGNPLFALELARALHESGARSVAGEPLPVPAGLTALLQSRFEKLPAGARQALLVVALTSNPTSPLVEKVLGPSATQALERAWDAGVIEVDDDRIRFAHPLYASTVASTVRPDRRRSLHRRLAAVIDDPEEQARHLALATTAPDQSVAQTLDRAAGVARSRAAWAEAAALLERAYDLTPADHLTEKWRRGIGAAEDHVHAGDRARGRELVEQLLQDPLPSELRADALRLLAEITADDENLREAERLYHEALQSTVDPRLAASIELGLVYTYSSMMDWPTGAVHARHALTRAEGIADGPLAAQALSHCAMLDFLCGHGVDWSKVERALQLEDASALGPLTRRPSVLAASLLLYEGRHDEARQRFTALHDEARDRGDESDLAFVSLWLSWLETRCGDLAAAEELADEAASLAVLTGSTSMHAWALTQQAFVQAHLGDPAETRRRCAEAVGPVQRSESQLPHIWLAASLCLLELSLGNPEAAWRACEPLVVLLEQHGLGEPVPAFFLPDAIEALVAMGKLDRADTLLTLFEDRGRALDRTWALATAARCRGLHLGASGDLTGAVAALDRSLAEHERIELAFERARTLLTRGIVERRAGKRTDAQHSLAQARAAFDAMGARLWAERADTELTRLGARAPVDALTVTEQRVAELVAVGHTNREVARTLFVSEKTVEANLTRIYRKLGLRSRVDLVARIDPGQPERGGPSLQV